jgi:hypothetical protein
MWRLSAEIMRQYFESPPRISKKVSVLRYSFFFDESMPLKRATGPKFHSNTDETTSL